MKKMVAILFVFVGGLLHAKTDTTNFSPRLSFNFDFGVSGNAGSMLSPIPSQFYSTGYGMQEIFHGVKEKAGAGYSLGTVFYPIRTKRFCLGMGINYSIYNYRGEIRSVEIINRYIDTVTDQLEHYRKYAYNEMLVQFPVIFRTNFFIRSNGLFHLDLSSTFSSLDRINFPEYSHTEMVSEKYRHPFSVFYSAGIFYDHIENDFIFPSTISIGLTAQILSDATIHNRKPFFIGMRIGFSLCSFKKT
jgi:hypothetical protein